MKDVNIFSYLVSLGLALLVNHFFVSKLDVALTIQLLINLLIFTFVLIILAFAQKKLKRKKK